MAVPPNPVVPACPAGIPPNYPDPIIEPNFNFNLEFCEETSQVDGVESGWNSSMAAEAAQATMRGTVPWTRLYAAIQFFLGVNWVDYQTFPKIPLLRRLPPHQHPLFPWLYCTKILNMTGFGGKRLTWNDLAGQNPPVSKYISMLPPFNLADGGSRPADNFGTFDRVRLTLQYEPLPYQVRFDSVSLGIIPEEWRRNLAPVTEVQNMVVTIQEGNFLWAEGPGATAGPKNTQRIVDSKTTKIFETEGVWFTWHRVPHEWVHSFTSDINAPGILKIFSLYQGLVNSKPFLGFPPQTLRLLAPKKSKIYIEPCWVRGPYLQRSYDITIGFQYFEPQHQLITTDGDGNLIFRGGGPAPPQQPYGHNLALYKDFNFWGISHNSVKLPGIMFYNNVVDFYDLFKYWCTP